MTHWMHNALMITASVLLVGQADLYAQNKQSVSGKTSRDTTQRDIMVEVQPFPLKTPPSINHSAFLSAPKKRLPPILLLRQESDWIWNTRYNAPDPSAHYTNGSKLVPPTPPSFIAPSLNGLGLPEIR